MIADIVKNHIIKSFNATTQDKFSYIVMPGLFIKIVLIYTLFKKSKKKSYNSVNNNTLHNKHLFTDDGRILIVKEDEKKMKTKYILNIIDNCLIVS